MPKDKNNVQINLGDMIKFMTSEYYEESGIVNRFSAVSDNIVYVIVCEGGGEGVRCVVASESEKITSLCEEL